MARIRTIKPEFFTSLTIADLPTVETRLTFVGLWTHVDDEGRCVDDARLVKAAIWPLDDRTSHDVETDLKALTESSLITRYKVGERSFIQVTNWGEHQRINRPTPSKHPGPDEARDMADPWSADDADTSAASGNEPSGRDQDALIEDSVRTHGGLTGGKEQGTGNREQGEEANASSGAAKPRTRKVDPIWDALMLACGVDISQIPDDSRGAYNRAVSQLKKIKATPGQITLRAKRYRDKWPTASLTPTALVRRWPELDTGAAAPVSEAETERCPKHKRQSLSNCQICDSEKRGAA